MNRIKIVSALSLICIVLLAVSGVSAQEQSYNKNISVVFDDSGSMAFDVRWAHANYAIQTLVSVLDEGDILQIHYMNDSSKDIAVKISDKESTEELLNLIRENSVPDLLGAGETPIDSIKVGMSKLAPGGTQLQTPGTEYDNWLVLITDGNEMTSADGEKYANYVKDDSFDSGYKWVGVLDRQIGSILSGSSLEFSTVILKIGDTAQDMLLNNSMIGHPLVYKSASVSEEHIEEKQIVENMNDIASLVSGRYPISIKAKSGTQLTIESEVPFNNFDLLLQNSNSTVSRVLDEDGNEISFSIEETKLLSPDNLEVGNRVLESDTNLYGSAIRLNYDSDEALSEGVYRVVFTEDIENAKVTSYCYPFIQFGFKYYVNGLEVDKVFQEDMVTMEFIPLRGGTEEVLTSLPAEINYTLELKSGDQFLSFKEGSLETNPFLIRDSILEGSLTAEIPDIWRWSLNVSETIPVAPEEERAADRIFTLELSSVDNYVSYGEFENAMEVLITPKLNGERLSAEEIEKANLDIVRIYSEDGTLTSLEYELLKEGTIFTFKPTYNGFKPAMPSGDYTIEVRFEANATEGVNEYAFSEFTYEVGDAHFLVRYFRYVAIIAILVVIGIYLIGIVIRPKLSNKKHHIVKYYYESIIDMDSPVKEEYFPIKVNQVTRYIIPFVREKGDCQAFCVKAGRHADHVYLTKETQKTGMRLGTFELRDDLVGKRDLRLNLNQKLERIEDGRLVVYKYETIKASQLTKMKESKE